jgi:hypothetical protein
MMNEHSGPDFKAIEENISTALANPFPRRPSVSAVPVNGGGEEEETKVQAAMRAVNRKTDLDVLQVEAFIDRALAQRIIMMRGHYTPGPRDAYVRRMVLEAIMSINANNGDTLD